VGLLEVMAFTLYFDRAVPRRVQGIFRDEGPEHSHQGAAPLSWCAGALHPGAGNLGKGGSPVSLWIDGVAGLPMPSWRASP
jgi:hypothetical protein